jgi:hypothetical protein
MQTDSNFQAPHFQNVCFDHFRKWCKENSNQWPSTDLIRLIDRLTSKNSLLRKFTIDSMISKNPLKTLEWGSKERKDWDALLDEIMELGVALAKSEGPNSLDTPHPWEDQCRDRYLEEEFFLGYRWKIAILLREKEEDIEKNKEKGSRKAQTEWEHLERVARSVDTPSSMKTGSSLVRSGDPEPENRSINKPTPIAPDLARAELALANQNRQNGSVGKPLSTIYDSSL